MAEVPPRRLGRYTRDNVPFYWPTYEDGKWRIRPTGHEITIPALEALLTYHRRKESKEEDARLYRWFYRRLRPLVPAANAAWQREDNFKTDYKFNPACTTDGVLLYMPNRRNGITIHLPEEY